MRDEEARAWLEYEVPPQALPVLASVAYDLILQVITEREEADLHRLAAKLCEWKAGASAEMHAHGLDDAQEQQIFEHWRAKAKDHRALAATIAGSSSSELQLLCIEVGC